MVREIRSRKLSSNLKGLFRSFKLFAFLGVMILVVGLTFYLTTQRQDIRQRASDGVIHSWGNIANPELSGQLTKGVFFFAGPPNPNSIPLYTRNPIDASSFNWTTDAEIDRVFDSIQQSGANVIKLSWWGTGTEYQQSAPTFNNVTVNNQVFAKAKTRNIMVAPLIEVSPAFKFYEDFPTNTSILESHIKHLLTEYGQSSNWLKMYDKTGQERKVIWLIETIHLGAVDKTQFATAFDTVARKIETETGHQIGFIIDPTPLPPNGSYEGPDPTALLTTESLLAINPFNITSDGNTEQERLEKAEEILRQWNVSGIPLIASIIPGYDDHIVRPPGQIYGDSASWRTSVENLAKRYQTAGITLDIWNGFTEGYAFAPTTQNQSENYNMAKRVFDYLTQITIPTPTLTPTPTNTPTPPTNTPTPTATTTTGTLNVTTSPSTNSTIKIVNYSNGNVVLTGTKSIDNASLPVGTYYVTFAKSSIFYYRQPRITSFYIKANKTTNIIGDYRWGIVSVKYR